VVIADVNDDAGRQLEREIAGQGGRALFVHCDIGAESDAQAAIERAEAEFGGLDVLINSASAPYPPQGLLAGWFDAVQVDLLGTMYATWHAIPVMRRRGGGAIVNISSTSALGHGHKPSSSPGYDVAKIGVLRLATMLAPLAEKENIRVNCLLPDWVASPEVKEYFDALTPDERAQQGVPPVLTTLDEISDPVVTLATDVTLAGRVMVWWSGQEPKLLPTGDIGHAGWD
jgi:NAD(P)-dependent dehydrogenase (short-subunit alcohol dehydrogenase family)